MALHFSAPGGAVTCLIVVAQRWATMGKFGPGKSQRVLCGPPPLPPIHGESSHGRYQLAIYPAHEDRPVLHLSAASSVDLEVAEQR